MSDNVVHLRQAAAFAEIDAAFLAERAAMVLTASGDMSACYRAELIRATAEGNISRALDALAAWAAREKSSC